MYVQLHIEVYMEKKNFNISINWDVVDRIALMVYELRRDKDLQKGINRSSIIEKILLNIIDDYELSKIENRKSKIAQMFLLENCNGINNNK